MHMHAVYFTQAGTALAMQVTGRSYHLPISARASSKTGNVSCCMIKLDHTEAARKAPKFLIT